MFDGASETERRSDPVARTAAAGAIQASPGSAVHGRARGAGAGEHQRPPPPERQPSALVGLRNQCVRRNAPPRAGFALTGARPQGSHLLHELLDPGLLHAARVPEWIVFDRSGGAGCSAGVCGRAAALPRPVAASPRPHGRHTEQLEAGDEHVSPGHRPRKIPLELQRLFSELQLLDQVWPSPRLSSTRATTAGSDRGAPGPCPHCPRAHPQDAVATRRLTENGFGWDEADASVQHDVQVHCSQLAVRPRPHPPPPPSSPLAAVQELNRLLFDAIEQSLRGKPGRTLIHDLYGGVLAGRVQCRGCGAVSEREEPFTDISVPVQGATASWGGVLLPP